MTKTALQTWGLVLDIVGVILLACGALDKSSPTWDDLEKKSIKTKMLFSLSWIGVGLAVLGFVFQIIALYL